MQPAVFLDRDNTLIANDGDLGDPQQVRLLDGVASGCRALREAGYQLVVVSNQGGVARGKFTEDDVDRVHQRIAAMVDEQSGGEAIIERFYYCPFHPEATLEEYRRDHPWRKPHPGMLLQAATDLDLDLERSWLIGDQVRDIEAGRAVGCRTILVSSNGSSGGADLAAKSFAAAVGAVLGRQGGEVGGAGVSAAPGGAAAGAAESSSVEALRRTVRELTDELRAQRARRAEFTMLRLGATLCQMLVVLLVVLGLLQIFNSNAFMMWMTSAVLIQLVVVTLLLLDRRS